MKRTITTLTCTAALALSLVVPAHAYAPSSQYTLTLHKEFTGDSRQVTLDCDPAGGTHPRAQEACAAVERAGSVKEVQYPDGPCPMIYDPVTATVTGAEEYEQSFANECVMNTNKGPVFDF